MTKIVPTVLEDIPNIGPSIAADLRRVGVRQPADLVSQAPDDLYRAVCEETGTRQDPCLLDVFISAVRFMNGHPPRPWWHYTAERKRRYAAVTAPTAFLTRPTPRRSRGRAAARPAPLR